MKLSDAMRLGSKLNPQGITYLKMMDKTCALGAALDGIEAEFNNDSGYLIAEKQWPELLNDLCCPVCNVLDPNRSKLRDVIYHLNDKHMWTREQIADWIDSLTVKEIVVEKEEKVTVNV